MLAPAVRRRTPATPAAPVSRARPPPAHPTRPPPSTGGLTPAYLPATDLTLQSSRTSFSSEWPDDALVCRAVDRPPPPSSDGTRPDPRRPTPPRGAPRSVAVAAPHPPSPASRDQHAASPVRPAGSVIAGAARHAAVPAGPGHHGLARLPRHETPASEGAGESRQPPPLVPVTGGHWLTRDPIEVPLRVPAFTAARRLDIEPAPPPRQAQQKAAPLQNDDYRGLYEQATESAYSLYRRMTEEAARIVDRWRDRDRTLADRHQSGLDTDLATLDDGLGQARARLAEGRAWMHDKLDGAAAIMRSRIAQAAATALQALAARHAIYERDLVAPRVSRLTTELQAWTGKARIAGKAAGAIASLDAFSNDIPGHIRLDAPTGSSPGAAVAAAVAPAVREAKIDFVPSRITNARNEVTATGNRIDTSFQGSFGCLPCEFDRAFQALDARVNNVAVLGPRAVLAARAGGLHAVGETVEQLRAAIEEGHAATDAMLVQQHDRARDLLIRNAAANATRERASLADAAERQSDMLDIMGGAQSTAIDHVHDWLETQANQPPATFAQTVSQAALRLRANLGGIGDKQPRLTSDARERLDARMVLSAEAFERQQADLAAHTGNTLGDLVAQSIDQLDQRMTQTIATLDHVPHDVRASCNGYLEPMGPAYRQAVDALTAAVAATHQEVESAFTGDRPTGTGAGGQGGTAPHAAGGSTPAPRPGAPPGVVVGTPAPAPASCGDCHRQQAADSADGGGAHTTTAGTGTTGDAGGSQGGGQRESPNQFADRCDRIIADPTAADEVAAFFAQAAQRVPQGLADKIKQINNALGHLFSPDTNTLMGALRGLTAIQGGAIRALYSNSHGGRSLDDAIRMGYLNAFSMPSTIEANTQAAIDALNGNATGAAMSELRAAFNFSNEDQRIRDILLALTPLQLAALKRDHGAELDELATQLDGEDRRIFDQLMAGNAAYADASTLRHDIDTINEDEEGEERGDKLANRIDRASHESHALAGDPARYSADLFGLEDPHAAGRRLDEHWARVQSEFATLPGVIEAAGTTSSTAGMPGSTLFAYATRPITHEVQSYGAGEGPPPPPVIYQDTMDPYHRAWIEQILRHGGDSDEARGAHLLVERRRASGDPNLPGLDAAIHVEDSDLGYNADGSRQTAEQRRDAIFLASERLRHQLEGGDPAGDAASARQAVAGDFAHSFSEDANAHAIAQSIVGSNEGNPRAVIDYMIAHESTELARRYLGRMNRDQIDTLVSQYNADHPEGPGLYERLGLFDHHWSITNWNGAVFSGDEANELEIAFMGRPRNDRERAEVALRVMNQQIEQSGWMGRLLAGEEYDALVANAAQLRETIGVGRGDIDELGRIRITDRATGLRVHLGNFDEHGNFVAPRSGSATSFETAVAMAHTVADAYTAATDRIASYITTALMVVAAVVTTALTGGAAASIWIPVLVTAGAGLVGMGLTAAIKGGRYSRDEIVRDLAMTVVQAATAGIGAAAGTALRGGSAALKTLAGSMRVSEEALSLAAGPAGMRALSAFEEVAIGAGSGALSGGVGAAVDPAARHGEHYGMGILHGVLKGLIGGGAAAGATRVVAGGVNSLARGLGARSGARAALEAGASEEAALRMAALRSRAYGTSFITEAGSRALGAGVGGIASRGSEILYDRGVRHIRLPSGQVFDELSGAFFQNAAQGFLEASADRSMRALSSRREAEHAWTTRDDQRDYDERARKAVDAALGREPPPTAAMAPEEEPHLRLPTHPPEAEPPPRVPEVAPTRPPEPEAEPIALPRSVGDERSGGGRILEGANDNGPPGTAPARTRVALGDTDMVNMGRIAEGTVFMHPDSQSPIAANDNFGRMIIADPTREAAIYHNPVTGEYIVIQGERASVGAITPEGKLVWGAEGENSSYAWQSLLNRRDGHWVLRTHYHPNAPGEHATGLILRLPSGRGGDFGVIHREVTALGHDTRSSRIYFNDEGHVGYTDFGYDPGREGGPFWVDFPHPDTGARVVRTFANLGDYDTFVTGAMRDPQSATGGAPTTPIPRTAEEPPPRALAPGSREVALTPADRPAIAGFHEQMQVVRDHEGVLRALTVAGASESTLAAAHGWLADAQAEAHGMAQAMGLVGEPDSLARLHLLLNDPGMAVEARGAMADAVLAATRAQMIAAGELGPDEPLALFYHGAPADRTRSLKEQGVRFDALGRGTTDDFGRGLYLTQDVGTAALYTRSRHALAGLRPGEAPGEIFPFILRGRDMGTVVDVGVGGAHRDQWEAFARAHYFDYDHLPNPEVDLAMIRGQPVPFDRLDGFGPRGELFDRFLATLEPPFNRPAMVFGELGGPFTSGVGRGTQQAARDESVLDMLDRQMGMRRAVSETEDVAIPRSNAARRRKIDPLDAEIDRMFDATFDMPPGRSVDDITPAERAAAGRQATRRRQAIDDAVTAFEGGGGADAAALRRLRRAAPDAIGAILQAGGDGAPGLRRTGPGDFAETPGSLTPAQREAVRAELARGGMKSAAVDRNVAELERLLAPGGTLRTTLAHAAERAAWTSYAEALTPQADAAIRRYFEERMVRRFINRSERGMSRDDKLAMRRIDADDALAAFHAADTLEDRLARYAARRRAAGAPATDIAEQVARLRAVFADPGLAPAIASARKSFAGRGVTADALGEMLGATPELLALARANPDYVLERYAREMVRAAGRSRKTDRYLDGERLAEQVQANQDAIVKPIVSEASAAAMLARRLGLHIVKADALSRGRANAGGIDIVGIEPRRPGDPRTGPVRVALIDDKALASPQLGDVTAMTGAGLARNLAKAADEIEGRIAYGRRRGIEPDPDELRAIAQMRDAASALDRIHRDRRIGGSSRRRPGEGGARHQTEAYARAVARVLAEHNISLIITGEIGNVRTLAPWLGHYRMQFIDDYLRTLEDELRKRRR